MRYPVVLFAAIALIAAGCGTPPRPAVQLQAPDEILAGSHFDVTWAGPDSVGDYVTIVPAGAPEGEWTNYGYTRGGNPITLTAPLAPGSYEIRYATERTNPDSTLARITVTVKPVEASVSAPAEVEGGSTFDVTWSGPDGDGIYVVLVPEGTAEGEWVGYEWHYVSDGNPIPFVAPVSAITTVSSSSSATSSRTDSGTTSLVSPATNVSVPAASV